MSIVKDKIVLCQIGLADFSIESVNEVPFYKRYSEFCKLFASKIPTVDFESCFTQPQENNAKKTIEWFFKPGSEVPIKLSELKNSDPELYHRIVQKRNEIVSNIRTALNKATENDQKYLTAVLAGLDADYIDSITYSYDDRVLFGIWGMRTKTGRQIDSVITEGVLDHRAYQVTYQIQGDGCISPFSSINRRYGHILHGEKDIPRVTPNEGSYFKEWLPEAPHGKEVKSDMVYTAVCEKNKLGGESSGGSSTDGGRDENPCHILFNVGEQGQATGQTEYEKSFGEHVLSDEIPTVTPKEGYRFVGWDKNPDGHVVNDDVEFVAQYEKIENSEDQLYQVRFDEGEHGILHGQVLYKKNKDDKVLESEIPEVEPKDGYSFVGWDKKPNNHVVTEDVTFVAQYEEREESWWSRFWGWGSGCLNWLLLLLLLALIGLLLWYLLGRHNFNFCGCNCGCNEIVVVQDIPVTPEPEPQPVEPKVIVPGDLPKPTKNCGVHFSGWYLSDRDKYPWTDCSEIFKEEKFGEYVGQGLYPDNTKILPKSMEHSFDAVAVSRGTRLIIYSKPNFKGRVVLDVKGPVLIENVIAKGSYDQLMTYTFKGELQELFPPERRQWSSGNMHDWSYGSCKIICEQ